MAIRLRRVDGKLVALCAARSMPKDGDVYLDDEQHYALTMKFMHEDGRTNEHSAHIEREESGNPAREWWDAMYGAHA